MTFAGLFYHDRTDEQVLDLYHIDTKTGVLTQHNSKCGSQVQPGVVFEFPRAKPGEFVPLILIGDHDLSKCGVLRLSPRPDNPNYCCVSINSGNKYTPLLDSVSALLLEPGRLTNLQRAFNEGGGSSGRSEALAWLEKYAALTPVLAT